MSNPLNANLYAIERHIYKPGHPNNVQKRAFMHNYDHAQSTSKSSTLLVSVTHEFDLSQYSSEIL